MDWTPDKMQHLINAASPGPGQPSGIQPRFSPHSESISAHLWQGDGSSTDALLTVRPNEQSSNLCSPHLPSHLKTTPPLIIASKETPIR